MRSQLRTVTVLSILSLAACSDDPSSPSRIGVPSRPDFNFALVDDGTYTEYGRDVTFTTYDGYAEVDGQAVTIEQNFAEAHTWQGTDYDGTITFPSADNTFGSAAPEAIDIARIYSGVDGSTTAYDRSGNAVPMGDPEVDEMSSSPEASGTPSYDRAPDTAPVASVMASRPPREKREPVDRVLVTAGASQRTLARLQASSIETRGLGGVRFFTSRDGGTEIQKTWDPGLGAITEVMVTDATGQTMRTSNQYTRSEGILLLTEESTTIRDVHGKLIGRFKMTYRNHHLR